MLCVDMPGSALHPSLLQSRGGFLWWYVDATNADGDGFVCIWSFGLPFLPGLMSSARAGAPHPPAERPSVNLAVYRRGLPISYHLTELHPDDVRWDGARWQFGACSFAYHRQGGRAKLDGHLSLSVPGSEHPLIGDFSLEGPEATWSDRPPRQSQHGWAPMLAHGTATAQFTVGGTPLIHVQGSGYHDRNGSSCSLDELGVQSWFWARGTVGDRTVILYVNVPQRAGDATEVTLAFANDAGELHFYPANVTTSRSRRGWFGMAWPEEVTATPLTATSGSTQPPVRLRVGPPVDDGPFYVRCPVTFEVDGAIGAGWLERCEPARIDGGALRPLVKMAVQPPRGLGSLWAPLFLGPRAGRWTRLVRWWIERLRGGAA